MFMKKRVLSGIQSSGDLHIGNYFGAIRQWVNMQDEYECYFFLADLHALTTMRDADELRRLTREAAIAYVACGLEPEKVVLFRQSDISFHTEAAWILSTVAPMGLLERAHSYKDKIAKGIAPHVGLFTYPILMACDILLYSPHLVPVGKDQKQHVEITRDLAEKFNHTWGSVFDPLPEPFIPEEVAVVPGTDGKKMSKSYNNVIPLFGTDNDIKKCVMGIVTDSAEMSDVKQADGNTIYELYKLVASDNEVVEMKGRFEAGGYGYGEAKKELLRALLAFLAPFWERRDQVVSREGYIDDVIAEGNVRAYKIAGDKFEQLRGAVGL
jgi:tryptophanyl-tRNA synthetase